ncbi:2-keto-3-deoxy-galactonokinase [Roseovarius litorisediminis]|uniref:2-keto-3-deoxy-galactonokinase n=1 Tax=Roseovarius litorisediminis TaxID=1312363 RepID=A0A1Y5RQ30_9RHOB|nr:2-dehydro-3-deoxygalactonokinase [Roseovarius litorisediminis]SLN19799.1 2-keto-3-deoxy-galactonokinase [Roseovarius litorisediminis]
MTAWIAMGRSGAQVTACAMKGVTLLRTAQGVDEAAALSHLDYTADRILRIGDGAPAKLPAPVLPNGGRGLPGFTQDNPPDVIGGWVRLWIIGFLAQHENWDGVICACEGDVTHWIHISAREAVSCQSFLTQRLVTALGGTLPPDDAAIDDSLSRPERLAAHLRIAEVTGNTAAVTGHLIGAELAAARAYWLGQQVALIAADRDASGYGAALNAQGVPLTSFTPEALMPAALAALGKEFGLTG